MRCARACRRWPAAAAPAGRDRAPRLRARARGLAQQEGARHRASVALPRERPHDLYSWFKLLELARFWGDRALWSEAATSVSGVLEAAGPMALAGKPFGGELIALCADGLFPADDVADALRFINNWAGLVDPVGGAVPAPGRAARARRRDRRRGRRLRALPRAGRGDARFAAGDGAAAHGARAPGAGHRRQQRGLAPRRHGAASAGRATRRRCCWPCCCAARAAATRPCRTS